ncbi:MAG: AI-2E family transporter [Nanoarchaeota archaeon]
MEKDQVKKYITLAALAILIVLSFMIIKSYIVWLISAFILAYLFHPLNKWFERKMSKPLAATITIIITLLIILIPISAVVAEITSQAYNSIQNGVASQTLENIAAKIIEKYNLDIKAITKKALEIGVQALTSITLSALAALLGMFIMIFAMYYMLTEWEIINTKIKKFIPFQNKEHLINEISHSTKKVLHGTVLIAVIEFVVAALGFWLAGSKFFLVLATMTALLAFIPGGPGLVWVPTLIIELLQKNYLSAGIILAFGLVISVYIDTIFRAKVAGKNARIHPLIALLGILGGTPIFGIPGIVIGPLFLSYTIEIVEEFLSENK